MKNDEERKLLSLDKLRINLNIIHIPMEESRSWDDVKIVWKVQGRE